MTTPREEEIRWSHPTERKGALMEDMSIAARTQLPTGTWHVDPAHSRIEFAVSHLHLGIATVRGAFKEFEGTLDLDEGRAYGTVKTASLDTSHDKRDEQLRSPDFFEVAEHPELRFQSTEIRPLGVATFEIEGDLTIRGVTNSIVLRAELQGSETDPWDNERIALEVTGKLDRSDWLPLPRTWMKVLVSDRVKLQLDIAAVKQVSP
jgi:polyisoprenoid-binding protein YceI